MKPEHNYYELWDNAMEKETKKIYMKDKLHKCGVLRILYSTFYTPLQENNLFLLSTFKKWSLNYILEYKKNEHFKDKIIYKIFQLTDALFFNYRHL